MRSMRTVPFALLLTSLLAAASHGRVSGAEPEQAGGAPAAPSKPATYTTEAALKAALKSASGDPNDMQTAGVSNTDQYRINMVHRTRPAGAIAHTVGTEVHHIIEGSATLVTGGTIVKGAPPNQATIQGGVSRRVTRGDVILVPENTPHWYKDIEGQITYLEVRFNVPAPKE